MDLSAFLAREGIGPGDVETLLQWARQRAPVLIARIEPGTPLAELLGSHERTQAPGTAAPEPVVRSVPPPIARSVSRPHLNAAVEAALSGMRDIELAIENSPAADQALSDRPVLEDIPEPAPEPASEPPEDDPSIGGFNRFAFALPKRAPEPPRAPSPAPSRPTPRFWHRMCIDKRGHVMWLTIDRPAQRNAMNSAVIARIRAGLEQAHADAEVRAVVLTGAGDKAFCAGADLAKGSGSFQFDPSKPHAELADLLRYAQTTTLPLIARVNGHCLAGGMGLLSMCDMAIASAKATFGLPEVKIGMFPMQVSASLRRIVQPRLFAKMCYSGESTMRRRPSPIEDPAVPAAGDWGSGSAHREGPFSGRCPHCRGHRLYPIPPLGGRGGVARMTA